MAWLKAFMMDDAVKMCRHDDVGIDAQAFLPMTEIETLGDDLASGLCDKDRQPFHHDEGHIEQGAIAMKSVAFHGRSLNEGSVKFHTIFRSCRRSEDARRPAVGPA